MRTYLRIASACLLAVVVVLGALGCGKQPIATVNGTRITKAEFVEQLEQAAGERTLESLIAKRLLEDAFAKSGLQVTQQEITDEIAKAKKQAPDEASWQAMLKQQGLDETKLNDLISFQLKLKKLSEKGLNPTDQDLKAEFAKYRQDFDRPATVVLSEIVVASKEQADKIAGELKSPKASFAALARQYSVSAFTRERGGRRPEEMESGIMPEALRGTVKSLGVGGVSSPIKVDDNWYIIKVEEKRAAEGANFDKIKDKVREHYMMSHGKNANDLLAELRKTARVNILDPKYQKLNQMFQPQQALPSFGGGQGQAPAGGAAPAAPEGGAAPAAPAAPAKQ